MQLPRSRPVDTTAALRRRLRSVYWIGGGSGAGKSTVARHLAAAHGLRRYSTDDVMADHARRAAPRDAPLLHAFMAMDRDERWVEREPRTMLATFPWFEGEAFDLIVEDLLDLPEGEAVIVEGFRLLPSAVIPLLDDARRALWLLPTPDFRRLAFESRGTLWDIAGRTTRPHVALTNLLERDRLFTNRLRKWTSELGLPTMTVDGTVDEANLAAAAAGRLGLGPCPPREPRE